MFSSKSSKLFLSFFVFCSLPLAAFADEVKLSAKGAEPIKETLQTLQGKTVTLRLGTGEEISGTVGDVGEKAVQLKQLSGRDFYDAVIALQNVSAVIVRAR